MFCNNCGNQIKEDEFFCVKCGAEATKQGKACCEKCGALIERGVNFCNVCGAEIKEKKLEKSFCQYCGEKFEKGNLFCKKCGQQLDEMRVSERATTVKKNGSGFSTLNNNVQNRTLEPNRPTASEKAFTEKQMFVQHIGLGCLFFALLLLWYVPVFNGNYEHSSWLFDSTESFSISIGAPFSSEFLRDVFGYNDIEWLLIVFCAITLVIDVIPMILAGIFTIAPVIKRDYSRRIRGLRFAKIIAIKTLAEIFVWLIFYNIFLIIALGDLFVGLSVGGIFLIIASVFTVVLSSYCLSQERKAGLAKYQWVA